jgi:hypothetical protein
MLKSKIPCVVKNILEDWISNRYEYVENEIADGCDKDDCESWIEDLNEVEQFIGDEGEHTYESIKKDIKTYYPKTK